MNRRVKASTRTADNSPKNNMSASVDVSLRKLDLTQVLLAKLQPKKAIERIREKMIKEDAKLSIGREAAFGEFTTVHVKPLKNQHLLNSARNTLKLKSFRATSITDDGFKGERKLPPPTLGKTMGHGIMHQSVRSSVSEL